MLLFKPASGIVSKWQKIFYKPEVEYSHRQLSQHTLRRVLIAPSFLNVSEIQSFNEIHRYVS